jgi:predicted nucleic acid-binding protein
MKRMRVYIDTSVFGGYFDDEFDSASRTFFEALFNGQAISLISDTLVAELVDAPERVQDLLEQALRCDSERLGLPEEAEELRDAYLTAGVLSGKWADDALHVAHAAVARADVIVSWNFRHLVNPLRIRGFNGVNAAQGYGPVVIMTPEDVSRVWKESDDEDQEDIRLR